MSQIRAVCLNCMDGRAQIPVITWIKKELDVEYVDMITEAGMDGFLLDQSKDTEAVKQKVQLSIDVNHARTIVIVGHHDCKGNPVSDEVHKEQIQKAVEDFKKQFSDVKVQGIWLNSEFEVEAVG